MAGLGMWSRRLFGIESEQTADSSEPSASSQPGGSQHFAADGNEFALAMYRQLGQRPGNLFFSPLSIRTVLCMAQIGARGETAAQMRGALRISSSDGALHLAFAEIVGRLNTDGGFHCEITMANSLWFQEGAPLKSEYVELIARHYDGAANPVDFRRAAEAARRTINRWVEGKTREKIRDLIPSGGLNADMRLVLVNAVYFKGAWELQFDSAATCEEPFHLEGGGQVQALLMNQKDQIRYVQAAGYQAVELVYRRGDLSMLVLLPDKKDGLQKLERRLSERMVFDCVSKMRTEKIKLFLPRFKMTWGADLGGPLRELGMPLAFTPLQADFSGINGHEPPDDDSLFISSVLHEAFLEVNERGTEAAAATAAMMFASAAYRGFKPRPIPVFRADHPFLFAIRDRRSGVILFLGRIVDPSR